MKFLLVLLIVAVVSAGNHIFGLPRVTQIFGNIKDSELDNARRLIGKETVIVDNEHNGIVEKIVEFPKPGTNFHVYIDAIAHYDDFLDSSVVSIVEGGVGHGHVKLKIQSKPGQRIESYIRFYGNHE